MESKKNKGDYCLHCENTGVVFEPNFELLDKDALTPCPECVLNKCECNGVEPYYLYKDKEIYTCPCRDTRIKIGRINDVFSKSYIEKKYKWKRFPDYKPLNNLSNEAKNRAYEIVRKFPNVKKGLFLWGNPGTGKTLLATIILSELIIKHELNGKFLKISRNYFNMLKSTFSDNSPMYGKSKDIEVELINLDVLVIDDFGVQRDSAWEQETLYNLLDGRYEAEKFTIITSNINPFKSLKDLSQGRILSRIKEMCYIMEISGEDYRDRL
jgi:DNA replication protein DnaC